MGELLQRLPSLATVVFTVTSMLSVGFGYTFRDVFAPLKNVSAVLRLLLANFVAVPVLATLLSRAFALDPEVGLGLELIGGAAGSAFLIKLAVAARADLAKSAAALLLLTPATVVYMPLVVPLMISHPELTGVRHASVSAGAIARPLVLTLILPLAVGLAVRSRGSRWAGRLQPIMAATSTLALVVLMVSTIALSWSVIVGFFGTGAILAALLLVAGAYAVGYLLGAPEPAREVVFGLATGQRNIAAALVVATQTIGAPRTTALVVAASLLGMIVLFPIAFTSGKRRFSRPPPGGAAAPA